MAINLENAAMKTLAKLESMPTEELVAEVTSNIQEPLAISIRELGYLNSEIQFTQVYALKFISLNESWYKDFKIAK